MRADSKLSPFINIPAIHRKPDSWPDNSEIGKSESQLLLLSYHPRFKFELGPLVDWLKQRIPIFMFNIFLFWLPSSFLLYKFPPTAYFSPDYYFHGATPQQEFNLLYLQISGTFIFSSCLLLLLVSANFLSRLICCTCRFQIRLSDHLLLPSFTNFFQQSISHRNAILTTW